MSYDALRWINLEPIGACNLACPHCPRDDDARFQGRMSRDLFRHLLEQVPEGCEVRLFLSGEPFLDRDLDWRVEQCNQADRDTLIHTNATVVDGDRALRVLSAEPTTISVSIDGATPEQYEEMRAPAAWDDAEKGVSTLLYWRDKADSSTDLVLQTIVPYPQPLEPNRGMKPYLDDFDRIYVRWPHNWAEMESVEGAEPRDDYDGVCSFLRASMSVQNDGLVVPCCAILNAERVIGDAKTTPLREIYGRMVSGIIEDQAAGRFVPVCSSCERYGKGEE